MQEAQRLALSQDRSPRATPLGLIQQSLSSLSPVTPTPVASTSPPGGDQASSSAEAEAGLPSQSLFPPRTLVPARLSDAENDAAHVSAGLTKSLEMHSYPAARDSRGSSEAGTHGLPMGRASSAGARESTGSSGQSLKITGLLEVGIARQLADVCQR